MSSKNFEPCCWLCIYICQCHWLHVTIRWHWVLGVNVVLIVVQALVVINHSSNAWNFLLAWLICLKVPSRLSLSIPSSIREERNLYFLLCQTKLVLVQTDCSKMDYILTLENQNVLILWRTHGGKLSIMPSNPSASIWSSC